MVEVDVRYHGERRLRADALETVERGGVGNGHADDLAAGIGEPSDLSERGGSVGRLGRAHGLHGDGRASPHDDITDVHGMREVAGGNGSDGAFHGVT